MKKGRCLNAFRKHCSSYRKSQQLKMSRPLEKHDFDSDLHQKNNTAKTDGGKKPNVYPFPLRRLCSRQAIQAAPTQNIMFVPLFRRGPVIPRGNKQKSSVGADEPAGREPRLLRPDTLMPPGVPVTGSCECSSKTRRLVSHESAEGGRDAHEHSGSASVSTFLPLLLFIFPALRRFRGSVLNNRGKYDLLRLGANL